MISDTYQTKGFSQFLIDAGFLSEKGDLVNPERYSFSQGEVLLDDDYIIQSGGILRAISRKSSEILRKDIDKESVKTFDQKCLDRWKFILMHCQPHLDEYLSSIILRACLPDEMSRIIVDETFLCSQTDDIEAKRIWPESAVLGVGNVVNGGAEPLLVFDEHSRNCDTDKQPSLVILMKRYLFENRRPPEALYEMIREVNYIDQYGTANRKSLSAYARYMQETPIPTFQNEIMTPEWKNAVMDACLAAMYWMIRRPGNHYKRRMNWEPAVTWSLHDYRERTSMRNDPAFSSEFNTIEQYLTKGFAYSASQNGLKYMIPNPKNPDKNSEAEYNMLVPYLPYAVFSLWGPVLGQIILFPIWECRINRNISFVKQKRLLESKLTCDTLDDRIENPELGTIEICRTKDKTVEGESIIVFDWMPIEDISSPSALNHLLNKRFSGIGFTIFHGRKFNSVVLTKGDKISDAIWMKVCEILIQKEGLSDDPEKCGVWHVTRNIKGMAGFLLNGNPTHRYVPKSKITSRMLVDILESISDAT